MQLFARFIFAVVALVIVMPNQVLATGPRVTTSLFSPHHNQIHALDFPPFVSSEVVDGGVISEIITEAMRRSDVDAVVTTHPVERMVYYYLLQESAMAAAGWHFEFTKAQREKLIFVPVVSLSERYYYYRPNHPQGLNVEDGTDLKGLRYGAHHGEEKSHFSEAGAEIVYGRTISLLKKMQRGEVDFICAPPRSVEWLLERYMKDDKANVIAMPKEAEAQVFYMVFNRQHPLAEATAEKFRAALNAMEKDGTIAKISNKHFGANGAGKLFLRPLDTIK